MKKPLIGITSNLNEGELVTLGQDNVSSIIQANGVPLILPSISDMDAIRRMAEAIDGLLVTGGGDVDPTQFGEEPHPKLGEVSPERDYFEINLIREVLKKDKPVLAICRGMQIVNVVMGGDLYQDIYAQSGAQLQHQQKAPRWHTSHFIDVDKDGLLYKIVGETKIKVNSYHHQAIRRVAEGFHVSAKASDGIIEAIESKEHRFVLGVQWHPENITKKGDVYSQNIFKAFVEACV